MKKGVQKRQKNGHKNEIQIKATRRNAAISHGNFSEEKATKNKRKKRTEKRQYKKARIKTKKGNQ